MEKFLIFKYSGSRFAFDGASLVVPKNDLI
jgi:hypothetical protein